MTLIVRPYSLFHQSQHISYELYLSIEQNAQSSSGFWRAKNNHKFVSRADSISTGQNKKTKTIHQFLFPILRLIGEIRSIQPTWHCSPQENNFSSWSFFLLWKTAFLLLSAAFSLGSTHPINSNSPNTFAINEYIDASSEQPPSSTHYWHTSGCFSSDQPKRKAR